MSKKANKYSLLQKEQNDDTDMIELTEFSSSGQSTFKPQTTDTINYAQLKDQNTTTIKMQKPKTQLNTQNNPKVQPNTDWQKYNVPPQNYLQRTTQNNVPRYATNPRQTMTSLNVNNTIMQNAPSIRQTKLPEMKVACQFCTFQQIVPATAQIYVCCCCNNMNECFPLYGLINCGRCHVSVCYPYGTSEMIRCVRCNAINKVSAEPKMSNKNQIKKTKQQFSPQTQLKSKPESQNLIKEEQIVIEEECEPVRPNNEMKFKEQELSFDDIPLNQKNEVEQPKYPGI